MKFVCCLFVINVFILLHFSDAFLDGRFHPGGESREGGQEEQVERSTGSHENLNLLRSKRYSATPKFEMPLARNLVEHPRVVRDASDNRNYEHKKYKRAAVSDPRRLWEDAIIPYDVDPSLPRGSEIIIRASMYEWEKHTCITFVKKSVSHLNFVHFTTKDCGCCTPVGNKRSGSQFFSIADNCSQIGNIMHELGHTIGFYHEQSRPDRDEHVTVHYENIPENLRHNFKIYYGTNSMGDPYDFESIMHYPLTYPRFGGTKMMSVNSDIPREVFSRIGQRNSLSKGDIRQANMLYKCPECGRTLISKNGKFGTDSFNMLALHKEKTFFEGQFCQWRIMGKPTDIIELTINQLRIPLNKNCSSYMNIRDGHKNSTVLEKICGRTINSPVVIKSSVPKMTVDFKLTPGLRSRNPGFSAEFRTVCIREIKAEVGNVSSHGFPGSYPSLRTCSYVIETPQSTLINLTFHVFEIDLEDNCDQEFIEVRDGKREDSPLLGRFCGDKVPGSMSSSSNNLIILFKSFISYTNQGFFASFTSEKKKKKKATNRPEKMKDKSKRKNTRAPLLTTKFSKSF